MLLINKRRQFTKIINTHFCL